MDSSKDQLEKAGINVHTLSKGDYFNADRVNLAYSLIDETLNERLARFQAGELKADPLTWACQKVIEHIHKHRQDIGKPVVCRCLNGGVRVLTDAEALIYLNSQANAGLRKHKLKTQQMFTAIDKSELNDHEKRELDANQRKHAFVLAAHQGARAQSLRMQRKGMQLPDYKDEVN